MSFTKSSLFQLDGKIAIITGGVGLLGEKHAEAILELGGEVMLWDIDEKVRETADRLSKQYQARCVGKKIDITSQLEVHKVFTESIKEMGRVDILVNNAACNPKVDPSSKQNLTRLENFSIEQWNQEIAVGLTGALICSQIVGSYMANAGGGNIVNIASDLGLIAPDQRLYRQEGLMEEHQPVKPVTYSVIKHGLVGLTRYLATYWADKGVRSNALAPGGVYQNQPDDFVVRLANLIPLGRMAKAGEYKGAIQFLVSEASSYMTGAVLVVDGGRSCW